MEEERKSVLSPEEIDFVAGLIAKGKEAAEDRILLTEQRELLMQQRLRDVWEARQDKKWETALNAIKEIPERVTFIMPDCYGDVEVRSIARVSIIMLFQNATSCLSVEQVKLVDEVLKRIDENKHGLGNEPWKTLFLENAKKSLPSNAREMVEAVGIVGIDKEEYIGEVLRPMISRITHDAGTADLVEAILKHQNLLSDISDFYGVDKLDSEAAARLLKIGDILLARWSRKYGPQYLEKVCQIYEWLNEKVMNIDKRRMEIVEIRDRYCAKEFASSIYGDISDAILVRFVEMKIRRIAKKLKII